MTAPLRRCPQQSLTVRKGVHQPVERRGRRHLYRPHTVGVLQNPADGSPEPAQRPGRPLPLRLECLLDRGDHPLVRAPYRRAPPGGPAVHQPPQALLPIAGPHPPHRHRTGRLSGRCQLGGLGCLPLRHGAPGRIELGTRHLVLTRNGAPGLHLTHMPLPGVRTRAHLFRQLLQEPERRHAALRGAYHFEVGFGEQEVRQDSGHGVVRVDQPYA